MYGTTLPDINGHTTTATGESCAAGWRELHPQLDAYQTFDAATETCTPVGPSGGEWHAASGNSAGWQEWSVDPLSAVVQNERLYGRGSADMKRFPSSSSC